MSAGSSYAGGSAESLPPNTCSGCGVEFGQDVEMYTPVASTKERQAAKKLMDNPPNEKLCPACFIEHIKSLDKKVLANVIIGMAKKIRDLNREKRAFPTTYPYSSTTIEKIYTDPNIGIITMPSTISPKTYPSISPPNTYPNLPYIGDDPNGGTVTY